MVPLGEEVEKRIELLFAPEERERARVMLVEECGENIPGWKIANLERLRFAVLKISDGKIHQLCAAVDTSKLYFRDVLMWAGFGDVESFRGWLPERKCRERLSAP